MKISIKWHCSTKIFKVFNSKFRNPKGSPGNATKPFNQLWKKINKHISNQREVVTTQAEKITEFRASLLDFQRALAAIREHIAQQETQLQQTSHELERVSQKQLMENQSTTENFEEVKQSINSVLSAFEEVSTQLANRLDEQDQKLLKISSHRANRSVAASCFSSNQYQSIGTTP